MMAQKCAGGESHFQRLSVNRSPGAMRQADMTQRPWR